MEPRLRASRPCAAMGPGGPAAQRAVRAPAGGRAMKVAVPRRHARAWAARWRASWPSAATSSSCSAATRDDLERSARDLERARPARRARRSAPRACDLRAARDASPPRSTRPRPALGGLDAVVVTAGLFATQERARGRRRAWRAACSTPTSPTPSSSASTRAGACSPAAAARSASSARSPASAAASRSCSTARPRPASRSYLEGLDHRSARQGLRTVVRQARLRADLDDRRACPRRRSRASPRPVARASLRAIDRGTPVVYAPRIWGW